MRKTSKKYECISYLRLYEDKIAPKLKNIDLLVKTCEDFISAEDAAKVLYISKDEIVGIMSEEGIKRIDRETFFKIMVKGSSNICKMYKREIERNSPFIYTREDVSYIYNIDINIVNKNCDILKMDKVTMSRLPELFAHIPVYMPKNA